SWSRRMVLASSFVCGLLATTIILITDPDFSSPYSLPIIAAALSIPFASLIILNSQIARSLNWILFASLTNTFLRPVFLLVVLAVLLIAFNFSPDALFVLSLQLGLLGLLIVGQSVFLRKKLSTLGLPRTGVVEKSLWLNTSLVLLVSDLYFAFHIDIHVLVSGFFLSAADLAIFNAVLRTLSIVGFASTAVGIAFAPQVAQLFASRDKQKLAAVARRALTITFWPALLFVLLQVIFAEPILSLFGPLYVEGRPALLVGAAAQLAVAFATPLVPMLGMTGNHRKLFWISLGTAILTIVSHALLTPRFGMVGSAAALLLASVFWCSLLYYWVCRSLQINLVWPARAPA
ncbi:MAG: hypothetical protein HKO07_09225, partial [Pseudomonadales bacterium]|nr:hypothetical protein [Pseudomonadales bacterium]